MQKVKTLSERKMGIKASKLLSAANVGGLQ